MENKYEFNLKPDENYIPEGLSGGFLVYNALGSQEILFADPNLLEMYDCKDIKEFREFTGNSFKGMVHPDDYAKIDNEILAQIFNSDKKNDYVRYRIVTKKGDVKYVEDFGHLMHGKNGETVFYVYIVDMDQEDFYSRSRNSFAESQIFASNKNSDRITGLMNMPTFYEAVQKRIDEKRGREEIAFVHFDIVNFKMFNENFGFQKGDDLLCRMAYTIRKEFPDAYASRLSNDHIAICTNADDVEKHVERVHDAMLSVMDFVRIEIKAGIYYLGDDCIQAGIACDRARVACNLIKRRYDKIYEVYSDDIHEKLRIQQYILDNIDTAVEKGYLKVYYQPIIRVTTGKICGYEALARWDDPSEGKFTPGQFIPTLEEYRMIHKVDLFIIKQVCEDLAKLREAGEPIVPVSVNLSRVDFELCDIFSLTQQFRKKYDIPVELLEIEITESAMDNKNSILQEEVAKFKKAGYHIWIDDFGSGYSSLNHLFDHDFDVLKLDLEFLQTIEKQPKAAELMRHIVQGAVDMGVHPLQEGVESEEHFKFLQSIKCERAQGFYFSRPMPLEESRAFTRNKGLEWE